MKYQNILGCVISLFFSTISLGQQHSIGIQSGFNNSNVIEHVDFIEAKQRKGFMAGLNYELVSSKNISFQSGIIFSQQGYGNEVLISTEYHVISFHYDYVYIPLKIGYVFGKRLLITPRVGIAPSLLAKAQRKGPSLFSSLDSKEWSSFLDEVPKIDIAALLDFSMSYSILSNIELVGSVGYSQSVKKFSGRLFLGGAMIKHKGYSMTLGMKYNLKKE